MATKQTSALGRTLQAFKYVGLEFWRNLNPKYPHIWHHYKLFDDLREDFAQRKQILWGRHYFNRCPMFFGGLFFFIFMIQWTFTIALMQLFVLQVSPLWNLFITLVNTANFFAFFQTWIGKCCEHTGAEERRYWMTYAGEPILIQLNPDDPIAHLRNIRAWLKENVKEYDYLIFDHQCWRYELEFLENVDEGVWKSSLAYNSWGEDVPLQYGVTLRRRHDVVMFKLVFGGTRLTKGSQLRFTR